MWRVPGLYPIACARWLRLQSVAMKVWLLRLWPRSLRWRLLLVLVPMLVLSIGGLGHVLTLGGESSLLDEKRQQLQGVNELLRIHLSNAGGFDVLEATAGSAAGADRAARIQRLNAALAPYTDQVARAFGGVGWVTTTVSWMPSSPMGPALTLATRSGSASRPTTPGGWSCPATSRR